MKKMILSLMGLVCVLTLTTNLASAEETQKSDNIVQGLSIGDHGG